MYLYQLSIDPEGYDSTPHSELVEVPQDDGTIKEFFRRRRLWVRLDYLMSAWAQTPEDEQLLLGLMIRTIMENPELPREKLKGQSFEDDFRLNILHVGAPRRRHARAVLGQPEPAGASGGAGVDGDPDPPRAARGVQARPDAPARVQVDHRSARRGAGAESATRSSARGVSISAGAAAAPKK